MSSSSSCSMRLRTTNVLRSSSIPAAPAGVGDDELAEPRHHRPRRHAEAIGTHRDVTPGDDAEAFVVDDALDRGLRLLGGERLDRQERQADGVVPGRAGATSPSSARRKRSGTWTRIPAPSPVSGSAPVAPRWSRLVSAVERRIDELAAGDALQVGDERHTARVVLEAGVVEAVTLRCPARDVLHSVVVLVHESRWSAWVVPGTTLARTVNAQSRGSTPLTDGSRSTWHVRQARRRIGRALLGLATSTSTRPSSVMRTG